MGSVRRLYLLASTQALAIGQLNYSVIFRKLDNTFRQARALNGVGWLQSRLGDYVQARASCQAALALFRHHRSDSGQLGESATLDSLGYIAYRSQEYDAAYRRIIGDDFAPAMTVLATVISASHPNEAAATNAF